jgi:hypothetical protein
MCAGPTNYRPLEVASLLKGLRSRVYVWRLEAAFSIAISFEIIRFRDFVLPGFGKLILKVCVARPIFKREEMMSSITRIKAGLIFITCYSCI